MTSRRAVEAVATLRRDVTPHDIERIRCLAADAGVFSDAEIETAVELAEERLTRGAEWGYHFEIADVAGSLAGFACYGPIPVTIGSFDLYWLVVSRSHQRCGIARHIMNRVEQHVRELGGRRLFVETSSLPCYEPARACYVRLAFRKVAVLPDHYGRGDDQVVFLRVLELV